MVPGSSVGKDFGKTAEPNFPPSSLIHISKAVSCTEKGYGAVDT